MSIKIEIKDFNEITVDPMTFQPVMNMNAEIHWKLEYIRDRAVHEDLDEESILNEISAYRIGKELIEAVQEQMNRGCSRTNEGETHE